MYRLLTLAHYTIRFLDFTMVNYGRVSAEMSKNRRVKRKYVPQRFRIAKYLGVKLDAMPSLQFRKNLNIKIVQEVDVGVFKNFKC